MGVVGWPKAGECMAGKGGGEAGHEDEEFVKREEKAEASAAVGGEDS